MKRIFFLLTGLALLCNVSNAQVINFGKTLPPNSYSIGIAPIYVVDDAFYHGGPLAGLIFAGYGINYNMDLAVKYGYYSGINDYFAAELQYLVRERRNSYYSIFGGIHKWEEWGIDLTGSFTYSVRYWLNLSVGVDIDLEFAENLPLRAGIPLNVGVNAGEYFFIFAEYTLPASERATDIFSLGLNLIIR